MSGCEEVATDLATPSTLIELFEPFIRPGVAIRES